MDLSFFAISFGLNPHRMARRSGGKSSPESRPQPAGAQPEQEQQTGFWNLERVVEGIDVRLARPTIDQNGVANVNRGDPQEARGDLTDRGPLLRRESRGMRIHERIRAFDRRVQRNALGEPMSCNMIHGSVTCETVRILAPHAAGWQLVEVRWPSSTETLASFQRFSAPPSGRAPPRAGRFEPGGLT